MRVWLKVRAGVALSSKFTETIHNLPRIVQEVFKYISDYKDDLNGVQKLHPKEWQRRYGMSTLPYFDSFLIESDGTEDGNN